MEKLTHKFEPGMDGVVRLTDNLVAAELKKQVDMEFDRIYLRHNIAKSSLNKIYSIRDLCGVPFATLEVSVGHVVNCYGKDKKKPDAAIIPAIQKFVFQNDFKAYPDAARNMDLIHLNNKLYDINNLPEDLVVNGDIYLGDMELTELPNMSGLIINGDFYVANNKLKTLKGAPKKVYGDFVCSWNELESIDDMPDHVGGKFDCSYNKIAKLNVVLKHVEGDFIAINNQIVDLAGMPWYVGGKVDLSCNQFADFWTGEINKDCTVPRQMLRYNKVVGVNMDSVKQRLILKPANDAAKTVKTPTPVTTPVSAKSKLQKKFDIFKTKLKSVCGKTR